MSTEGDYKNLNHKPWITPIVVSPSDEEHSQTCSPPLTDSHCLETKRKPVNDDQDFMRFKHAKKEKKHKTTAKKIPPGSAKRGSKCSVHLCGNTQYDESGFSTGLQFFIIPYDKTLSKEWISFLELAAGNKPVNINTSTKVCSAHFPQKQLDACYNSKIGKSRLKPGMVPSILSCPRKKDTKPSDFQIEFSVPSNSWRLQNVSAGFKGHWEQLRQTGTPSVDSMDMVERSRYKEASPCAPEVTAVYTCEVCEQTFICYGDYYLHIESHSGLPKNQRHRQEFECVICSLMHMGPHNIMRHMREHTTDKPYICTSCHDGFDSPKDRIQHSCIPCPGSGEDCEMIDDDSEPSDECVIIDLDEEGENVNQDGEVLEISCNSVGSEEPSSGKLEDLKDDEEIEVLEISTDDVCTEVSSSGKLKDLKDDQDIEVLEISINDDCTDKPSVEIGDSTQQHAGGDSMVKGCSVTATIREGSEVLVVKEANVEDIRRQIQCVCSEFSHSGSHCKSLTCEKCKIQVLPKEIEDLTSENVVTLSRNKKTLQQNKNTLLPLTKMTPLQNDNTQQQNENTQQQNENTQQQNENTQQLNENTQQQNDKKPEQVLSQESEEQAETPKRRVKFTQYECGECPDNFICYGDYYQHKQTHLRKYRSHYKSSSMKPTLLIACLVCRQLFQNSAQVIEHTTFHTHTLPFICDVCGEEFQSFVERKIHNSKPCGFDVEEDLSDEESHPDIYIPGTEMTRSKVDLKPAQVLDGIKELADISEDELAFVNAALGKYVDQNY